MANNFQKIEYHNLRDEVERGTLPHLVGRRNEIDRLKRVIGRRLNNNALLVAPNGMGKTTTVYGWVHAMCHDASYDDTAFLQLTTEHLYALDNDGALEARYAEALSVLPACVLFIDDFGREVCKNTGLMARMYRLYKQVLKRPNIHTILTVEPHEYAWLEREYPAFLSEFETMHLKEQPPHEYMRILGEKLPRLNARHRVIIPDASLREIVGHAERFPSLGQLPRSAVHLLDEAISFSASKGARVLTADAIAEVVATKTGVPKTQLSKDEVQTVRELDKDLRTRIVNQDEPLTKIVSTLQRAKLGLRNPNRPLGSFLMLGPSGVGKTETAKCVAEIMFGRQSFLRFDMSEFQQDHTVQRLIGAPAGYVGYEEGGALTNALKKNPHSLILLDEIEKAHPKVFDIFLQVLDDGRLTSGQNETVDARNSIIMATSNAAVTEILQGGPDIQSESFIREKVLPVLTRSFRLEFLNRFDSILVFNPLTLKGLVDVAHLEIAKAEARFKQHGVRFEIQPHVLEQKIRSLADPRFGARPVKRFVEETCETLLVSSLLNAQA